jgi:hypothetical protein
MCLELSSLACSEAPFCYIDFIRYWIRHTKKLLNGEHQSDILYILLVTKKNVIMKLFFFCQNIVKEVFFFV